MRYVDAISDTVDRAARLTSQLLAFARRQALRPAVFDAAQSVATHRRHGPHADRRADSRRDRHGRRHERGRPRAALPRRRRSKPVRHGAREPGRERPRRPLQGEGRLRISVRRADRIPQPCARPSGGPGRLRRRVGVGHGFGHRGGSCSTASSSRSSRRKVSGTARGSASASVFGFAKQSRRRRRGRQRGRRRDHVSRCSCRARPMRKPGTWPRKVRKPLRRRTRYARSSSSRTTWRSAPSRPRPDGTRVPCRLGEGREVRLAEIEASGQRFEVVFSDVVMPGMNGVDTREGDPAAVALHPGSC